MNITVNVDEITLDTVVGEVFGWDEDGDSHSKGEKTVGTLVAEQITARLVQDKRWPKFEERVTEIRKDVIRELVRPQIEAAIAAPIQKTNTYGEAVGEPTTLREVIVEEARKALNQRPDRYSSQDGTFLEQAVAKEVKAALSAEIKSAVEQARKSVSAEIGKTVAAAVDAGLKAK
jgi:hypothetical protein